MPIKYEKFERIILYEDNHLLAVNKPSGMLTQGDITGDPSLPDYVAEFIKIRDQKPGNVFVGVIHRIDRPSTGCVLLAKTSKGLSRMNALLRDKKIRKTYLILTDRCPDELVGTLTHHVRKTDKTNRLIVKDIPFKSSKKAILNYQLLAQIAGNYLFEIELITGRSHQIRAQFAHLNCPILGDKRYGSRFKKDPMLYLHCSKMTFEHPIKNIPIIIQAPLPNDGKWRLFSDFRLHV